MKTAPGTMLVFALLVAVASEGKNMTQTTVEHRFANLLFSLPATFRQVDDTSEDTPTLIPGTPPTREHFRSYTSPGGQGICFLHWEGFPSRDRGPMAFEQEWDVLIDGQKGRVSITTTFFDTQQRVLAAHFAAPNGDRYLIYQNATDPQQAPDRESFLAILETIHFQEAGAIDNPNVNVKDVLDQYKIELSEAGDRGQCDEAKARVREALIKDMRVSDADLQAEIDHFEKVKGPMPYPSLGTTCSLFGFQTVAHAVLEQRKRNPMDK